MRIPDFCQVYLDEGEGLSEAVEQIDRLAKWKPTRVNISVVALPEQSEEAANLLLVLEGYAEQTLGCPFDIQLFSPEEFNGAV